MTIFERFRHHMGWTQEDLGLELGVSKQAVSGWETETKTVKPETARVFVRVATNNGFSASLDDIYATGSCGEP